METERQRIVRTRIQRGLIIAALILAVVCALADTPASAPGYALGSNLILRIERAALPALLLVGVGGLVIPLWFGDKVSTTGMPGGPTVGTEEAVKPAEALKDVVDADARDLGERLLRVEKAVESRERDNTHE